MTTLAPACEEVLETGTDPLLFDTDGQLESPVSYQRWCGAAVGQVGHERRGAMRPDREIVRRIGPSHLR